MTDLYIQDVTLRDGMHAIGHRYTVDQVRTIAAALDAAGVAAIEVAHGDGLAGSSVNYGHGAADATRDWISAAAEVLTNAKLTTLLLPGIGTIADLRAAQALGVTSVRIATHCTEADISAQHISLGPGERHGRLRLPDDVAHERPGRAGRAGQADGVVRRALRLRHRLGRAGC